MPEVKVRLTETVKAGGCASKLSPAVLDKVLGKLPRQHDPNVLVGFDHADDAGVYKIGPDMALVQTVDFFTPIVDDPYTFGQIAATNALSDVYAMGGRPVTALAHVCFPANGDLELLEQILAGGLSKMMEASCTVVGGHSIRDEETKFGYSVTGLIDPSRIFTNGGAQPGDRLLFTKSLGTGVISTAIKQGTAKQSWIDAATRSMTTLNKAAAEVIAASSRVGPSSEPALSAAMRPSQAEQSSTASHVGPGLRPGQAEQSSAAQPIHSLTDVTGFGLIGHAREMALASNVSLRFQVSRIPILEGALDCIRAGNIPGGLKNNRDFAECVVGYEEGIPEELRTILFDPQTAGGLLIAVAPEYSSDLTRDLKAAGVPAVEIGEVLERTKPLVTISA
jgi:selenide,water dikinase